MEFTLVTLNSGDGGGMDHGDDGIFLCWGLDSKGERHLLDIKSEVEVSGESHAERTMSRDDMHASEGGHVVGQLGETKEMAPGSAHRIIDVNFQDLYQCLAYYKCTSSYWNL